MTLLLWMKSLGRQKLGRTLGLWSRLPAISDFPLQVLVHVRTHPLVGRHGGRGNPEVKMRRTYVMRSCRTPHTRNGRKRPRRQLTSVSSKMSSTLQDNVYNLAFSSRRGSPFRVQWQLKLCLRKVFEKLFQLARKNGISRLELRGNFTCSNI